jgi:hypothetical protein
MAWVNDRDLGHWISVPIGRQVRTSVVVVVVVVVVVIWSSRLF